MDVAAHLLSLCTLSSRAAPSLDSTGSRVTAWQVLPADAPDFEEAALRAWPQTRSRRWGHGGEIAY